MRPVRVGDRGAAVEDIQRRLRTLGYDLGITGIDGVFFGRTADAVRSFQLEHDLAEDGLVGDETWAALVDATFTLGDRMLYLRQPYFHGHDVGLLQGALSALGFACGEADRIFGPFTEHAVREFQRNAGLVPDGIAGEDTLRAIVALRHVWEGKDPRSHSAARTAPVRACEGLSRKRLAVAGLDSVGREVAERLANLALAANPDALITVVDPSARPAPGSSGFLQICGHGTASAVVGRPVVRVDAPDVLVGRLLTAVASSRAGCAEVVLELEEPGAGDEHEQQRAAVRLLDAVCAVFD
jgi:peptidoglycan hydrolase-like protein with peptidoglycan-binding domain